MIWVAKNLYFFNCLLDGAHTRKLRGGFFKLLELPEERKDDK